MGEHVGPRKGLAGPAVRAQTGRTPGDLERTFHCRRLMRDDGV